MSPSEHMKPGPMLASELGLGCSDRRRSLLNSLLDHVHRSRQQLRDSLAARSASRQAEAPTTHAAKRRRGSARAPTGKSRRRASLAASS